LRELKLNLGCGTRALPGFVNIDNSPSVLLGRWPFLKKLLFLAGLLSRERYETPWPRDIVWQDASKRLPYADQSVDKIYSSHALEHLDKKRGEALLRGCFRVLKRGGVFRLVVPDLEYHARRYLQRVSNGGPSDRAAHDDFLWNIYGAYLEKRRYGASHRYMYDWPTLQLVLSEIGFSRVLRQDFQTGLDRELCSLDNRPEESLHIDAIK
jgi:SAM-dependent methyltransferase